MPYNYSLLKKLISAISIILSEKWPLAPQVILLDYIDDQVESGRMRAAKMIATQR